MAVPATTTRTPPAGPAGAPTASSTPERACHNTEPGRRGPAVGGGVGVSDGSAARNAAWNVAGRLNTAAAAPPTAPSAAAPTIAPPISTPRRDTVRCPPNVIGGGGTLTGGAGSGRANHPGAAGATPDPTTIRASSSAVGRSLGRGLRHRTISGFSSLGTDPRSNRPIVIRRIWACTVPSDTRCRPVAANARVEPSENTSLALLG